MHSLINRGVRSNLTSLKGIFEIMKSLGCRRKRCGNIVSWLKWVGGSGGEHGGWEVAWWLAIGGEGRVTMDKEDALGNEAVMHETREV